MFRSIEINFTSFSFISYRKCQLKRAQKQVSWACSSSGVRHGPWGAAVVRSSMYTRVTLRLLGIAMLNCTLKRN